jgi:4-alpha-glucanotransferase
MPLSGETAESLTKKKAVAIGAQLSYLSAFGHEVVTKPEVLEALFLKLNLKPSTGAGTGVGTGASEFSISPIAISWEGKGFLIEILSGDFIQIQSKQRKITLKLFIDGNQKPKVLRVAMSSSGINVNQQLPIGYHRAVLEVGHLSHEFQIISAPKTVYQGSNYVIREDIKKNTEQGHKQSSGRIASNGVKTKLLGLFSPLYALHSKASLGIGDYSDLRRLYDWAHQSGVNFIGTLPLLSGFMGKPLLEASPYSPTSRLFWNEIYIDPLASPEWSKSQRAKEHFSSAAFQKELRALRRMRNVDYVRVAKLKRGLLEILSQEFFRADDQQRKLKFENYVQDHLLVEKYAEFCAVGEKRGVPWEKWPERLANQRQILPSDYRVRDKQFHLYVQWQAHEQLSRVSLHAKATGAGLYLDFPLSVHAQGFDVWWFREQFVCGVSAGAPPDPTFVHGQDWGILPLHPETIRQSGYDYFRRSLANHMTYAGILRLDHVMGFFRLFWVLPQFGAKDGVYLRYALEEFMAIVCLESHRHGCIVIGEDLGTVPDEIRDAMEKHGLLRMGIQQFHILPEVKQTSKFSSAQTKGAGARVGATKDRLAAVATDPNDIFAGPPENAIVSLNTHDLPLFAAFWQGLDLKDQLRLKYFKRPELANRLRARELAKKALLLLLRNQGQKGKQGMRGQQGRRGENGNLTVSAGSQAKKSALSTVLRSILTGTAARSFRVMQINIEDLWFETQPQNTPGTSVERNNWVRKASRSIESIEQDAELVDLLRDCSKLRQG